MADQRPPATNEQPERADPSTDLVVLDAIRPRGLLSFEPHTPRLHLGGLNVLVGPNGSGKSNLLEVVDLIRNTPGDLDKAVSNSGGIAEWFWKGATRADAEFDVLVRGFDPGTEEGIYREFILRHSLALRGGEQRLRIRYEHIDNVSAAPAGNEAFEVYRFGDGHAVITPQGGTPRELARDRVPVDASILSRRRDPDVYPELAYLARVYEGIRLYRDWQFGRSTIFRRPQQADLRTDRLEEDFSNLGLVLNRMRRQPRTKAALIERLRDLYDGLTDVDVSVEGGTVQVFFTEGDYVIPATRLSDGSLRYLCLLAILLDPAPPPLIGLEEPELGLHPDLLPKIADLLVDASTRTQLIVTTHSDTIIDALSERPECVVVFDKHEGRTTFERLDRTALAGWLEKYRLGQLWTRGQIGGTRW